VIDCRALRLQGSRLRELGGEPLRLGGVPAGDDELDRGVGRERPAGAPAEMAIPAEDQDAEGAPRSD